MAKVLSSCKYYLLLAMFLLVETNPTGRTINDRETNVVCSNSGESSDYVLKPGLVSDNNKTVEITLRGCKISDIDLQAFQNLSSLMYIDLSQNNISHFKLGVLDGARQVTHLNLSYNVITDFPLGLFDHQPNLEILDLKENRIEELKLGIFDPLKKLKHLDLSSNRLKGKFIDPYIFNRTRQINFLDFSRNDMSDAPNNLLHAFQVLEFLDLDRCLLTHVPEFLTSGNLKTLKHLILSTNYISSLENSTVFFNLIHLEVLDLADNAIEKISGDVFKPLNKLKVIILRRNRISHLPDTLFLNMKSVANIDLSHNMIETVPVNAFRGTSVKNLNLSDNRFTYLIDNFCLELRNSGAKLKKFYFNLNPWQCACLTSLLDEVKRLGIEYNSINYDGTHPICVTTNDVSCKRHDQFNSVYTDLYDDIIFLSS